MHVSCKTTSTDKDIGKITRVLAVVFLFMLIEFWGHFSSNSLSLLADSIHLLCDILGFLISLLSLKLAQKQPTKKMTLGHGRIEILGAVMSVFLIWAATLYLILQGIQRFNKPPTINGEVFVLISIVGLLVNIYCLHALHAKTENLGEKRNLNIRAAYIHVIGDLLQSAGVVLASFLLYINPKWVFIDIGCTLVFAVLVILSTFCVLKDALYILLERAPSDLDLEKLKSDLVCIPNVKNIERLYVWSIDANKKAVCVSILCKDLWKYEECILRIKECLFHAYKFEFVTIQVDTEKTMRFGCEKTGHIVEVEDTGFRKNLKCVNTL